MWVKYRAKKYLKHRVFESRGNDNQVNDPDIITGTGLDEKRDRAQKAIEKYLATLDKIDSSKEGPDKAVFQLNRVEYTTKFRLGSLHKLKIDVFGNLDDTSKLEKEK